MKIQIALDIWINKIFHTVLCFEDMFPTPQYVLHLSRHRDQFAYGYEKQSMYRLKRKGGKTLSLCRAECLRQKGLEKLCEIYTSWYKLCVLHDHCYITLTKWFHHDGKILTWILILSSSSPRIFQHLKNGIIAHI